MEENSAFGKAYVSLKLNGMDSELSPMNFSVTEFDSIYQFYPKVKIMVSDYEGVLNEYMAFIDGTQIEVTLGNTMETSESCKFVVIKNSVPQQRTSSNGIGGDIELECIHDYYRLQYKKSMAYQSNISDIISDLLKIYSFNKIDIEDTMNSGIWYQPYITDSDFIVNYLTPFAFSNSSQKTPYFTFIDSNNNFHFKSFNSMFNSTPIDELTYSTNGFKIVADEKNISSVCFSQTEFDKIKTLINTSYCNFDKDGNAIITNDNLLDYMKSQGKYPIVWNSNDESNLIALYDDDIKLDDTENNNKGIVINSHRDVMLPDKIIINTMLNKSLVCGNTVKITLPLSVSEGSEEKSYKSSGIYLIESSYHSWDTSNAMTTIVCSKQNLKLPDNYRNFNLLYK